MNLQPTQSTIKKLFALSGNRCSFPLCSNLLIDKTDNTVYGEIAHIKSRNPSGKLGDRYDPNQTEEENRSFENLILLCSMCHKKIDDNPSEYPVEKLMEYKLKAETENIKEISIPGTITNIITEELWSRFNQLYQQQQVKNITVPLNYIEDKIYQTLEQHKRALKITSLKREEIVHLVRQMNYDGLYPAFEPLSPNEIFSGISSLVQKKKLSINNELIIEYSKLIQEFIVTGCRADGEQRFYKFDLNEGISNIKIEVPNINNVYTVGKDPDPTNTLKQDDLTINDLSGRVFWTEVKDNNDLIFQIPKQGIDIRKKIRELPGLIRIIITIKNLTNSSIQLNLDEISLICKDDMKLEILSGHRKIHVSSHEYTPTLYVFKIDLGVDIITKSKLKLIGTLDNEPFKIIQEVS